MACGIGVCMTCVLPVVGDDGRTRMVRSCTEGPVFPGDRVRWDDVGTVPADAVGATPSHDRRRTGARRRGGLDPRRHGSTPHRRGPARRAGRRHDGPARRPRAAQPGAHGVGLRRRGPRARPVLRRRRPRRRRHQVDHARAAVRPADPADGRDRQRHAQLDRPAGAGHRRVPRPRPALAARARAPGPSCRSPGATSRSTPSWPGGCAAPPALAALEVNISCPNVENRGLVFACDPDAAAAVVRRRPPAHLARRCRCSPSSRRTSPTSSRSPGPCVDAGADGLSMINTLLGMAHRPRHHAARPRAGSPAGCPARRSSRSRCAASGRCTRPCRRCRSSGWAASAPAATRSSSSWPAPARCRSAPRSSTTRRPPVAGARASSHRGRWPPAASTALADAVRPRRTGPSPGAGMTAAPRSPSHSTPPTSRPRSAGPPRPARTSAPSRSGSSCSCGTATTRC